ncbi:GNAT family N-acetyltransferase [Paenibacillus allorhizosphaerae]|uniref:N-acetyltransferase domain-containing protein n=1 Tax=Paenibacillus allorhizosphaerae TaxID=2849866 RepID=A0ABM8VQ81_9BACL|nr:GNAT family N-acetyltransferase [Paenibacillus allorhizosphaerae]CAG7653890.1 hypothetical protein PAECIP111802_05612 [Paenibacillus allorhizosphaerae]
MIVSFTLADKKSVVSLYRSVTGELQRQGIRQWDWFYPNGVVVGSDIRRSSLFGVKAEDRVIAAVVIDDLQSPKYAPLPWSDGEGSAACIHRLAVHPQHQGNGLGKRLLQFAEDTVREQGHSSIRLDVYTGNPGAVHMYRRAGYREIGEIRFPLRPLPYLCFEKLL